jgi:hypothetical protein
MAELVQHESNNMIRALVYGTKIQTLSDQRLLEVAERFINFLNQHLDTIDLIDIPTNNTDEFDQRRSIFYLFKL